MKIVAHLKLKLSNIDMLNDHGIYNTAELEDYSKKLLEERVEFKLKNSEEALGVGCGPYRKGIKQTAVSVNKRSVIEPDCNLPDPNMLSLLTEQIKQLKANAEQLKSNLAQTKDELAQEKKSMEYRFACVSAF
ncbi:MAG: hypothetical protein SGPRY_002212 [Prymnesium sp.]